MFTFIQLSLKKSFHLNVQDTILVVDLAVPHCQLCNICVWYSLRNVECNISDMFFDSSSKYIDEKNIIASLL